MIKNSKILESDRIKLRKADISDLDFLYSLENDTSLWYVSDTRTPFSKFDIRNHLENSIYDIYTTKQLRLIVELQSNKEICGVADLFDFDPHNHRAGIGLVICEKCRLQGIAKESLELLIDYCRNVLCINQIWGIVDEDNLISMKLLKSLNFEKTGVLKLWKKSASGYKNVFFEQLIFD